ncbi:MAG TPA: hydantoinase/oxoprolinase family protein [Vicinamibacterales bacterium]|nr:hydantoinase/oxoprolinase family protein [Vicinamibacterales bacterium]
MSTLRIGVDTGGTFTDFVLLHEGKLRVFKVRSTPGDPSAAIGEGLEDLGRSPAKRDIVHGSTVATNAILERKGARVALVMTQGFEDVLAIGRQTRRDLYDVFVEAPKPLVSRDDTIGLPERMLHDGTVLVPLGGADLDDLVGRLRAIQPEAVALCLLHSYANPAHEQRVTSHLAAAGFAVSPSHAVLSEYREFERCSTTVLNAYVMPLMGAYLERLQGRIGDATLTIMQSNGGTVSAGVARHTAVQTILSGPAGGVVGATAVAHAAGFNRFITLDMGGTSTDVSLVDGRPTLTMESQIGDFPVRIPMLDIHTVGAGGGSIAHIDAGGALRVGPESAGSQPGPACYGSGEAMTVTDANVVLGRIDPDRFLGGRMQIFPDRALAATAALAARVHLEPLVLAAGVIEIANSNMERAIRVVSIERGHDPRDFALVAFGGAGGLHACEIAARLDMRTILVPVHPGVLSALGLLMSDTVCDFSQTVLRQLDQLHRSAYEAAVDALERKAASRLREDGFAGSDVQLERSVDLRYAGQAYEISIPTDASDIPHAEWQARVSTAFHTAHQRLYGYADAARPLEVVNVRVRGIGRTKKPKLAAGERPSGGPVRPIAHRRVLLGDAGRDVPVFDRTTLAANDSFEGPALAIDEGSTTWVAAEWSARADDMKNLVLTRRVSAS